MKKAISLFLTCVLIMSTFSFLLPVYATSSTEEILDLSQYSLEDIKNMSVEEYRELLRRYEKEYVLHDTAADDSVIKSFEKSGISPMWISGEKNLITDEWTEIGSHEVISAQALNVLFEDMGSLGDSADNVAALLAISYSSLLPDKEEFGFFFEGHFYHAIDGDSFTGSKSNTALTKCTSHFNKAVSAAKLNKMDEAYEEIGMALHYIQDAGEPHHAANITDVENPSHGDFEDFVDNNIETYAGLCTNATWRFRESTYTSARTNGVSFLVKGTVNRAYTYRNQVNNTDDQSKWDSVARVTVHDSVAFSSFLLYKFFCEARIPLVK